MIIAGGGLSGLTLGCALRREDVPVVLYEKEPYPRHRVCGEFICGVSDAVIEELGIADLLDDAIRIERMKWYVNGKEILSRRIPVPALGISRHRLDFRLAERFAEMGGAIKTESFSKAEGEAVISACGKKRSGKANRWIGLKCHLLDAPQNHLEMTAGRGGYLGISPVENHRANVCGLFERDPSIKGSKRELLLAYAEKLGCPRLNLLMKEAPIDEGSLTAVAGFEFGNQSAEPGFRLGDAAFLIPPFSGSGMSIALESAALALRHLRRYLTPQDGSSWETVSREYTRESKSRFRTRLRVAQALHPFFFHAAGQAFLGRTARHGWLPVGALFRLLRG